MYHYETSDFKAKDCKKLTYGGYGINYFYYFGRLYSLCYECSSNKCGISNSFHMHVYVFFLLNFALSQELRNKTVVHLQFIPYELIILYLINTGLLINVRA